ncbi:MAG: spore photoproduct lyase [Clostridiales bacterium]|nr:spore photoproduct lyase [Clostridiales bacterium]
MFTPKRILFEKNAIDYSIGKHIYEYFSGNRNIEIINLSGNRIMDNIPGNTAAQTYKEGKSTLVVGIKKGLKFQSCKPSAHYQLPLLSGCIGLCQYCYLNTNLGDRPYMRVNVNIDDIFGQVDKYIKERLPAVTIFEGSATSDPVPVEPYSNHLKYSVEYFSNTANGRFRFVTKFTDIDTLLNIDHKNHTEIRFTLNTDKVINDFEKRTPSLKKRIEASIKLIQSGYPTGFLIAPVFIYDNWKEDYHNLLLMLEEKLPDKISHPISFEIISHRYTGRAKGIINEIFPDNSLPMNDEERLFKYGQFGYGKFVYPKNILAEISSFFQKELAEIFKNRNIDIKYII